MEWKKIIVNRRLLVLLIALLVLQVIVFEEGCRKKRPSVAGAVWGKLYAASEGAAAAVSKGVSGEDSGNRGAG